MASNSSTVLVIDFGTWNTAAAWRSPQGSVHEVRLSSDANPMPSAVFVQNGKVVVGSSAVNSRLIDPGSYEASPKRRLPEVQITLGGSTVPVVELVAAVYRDVVAKAVRAIGGYPDHVILTHPDRWGPELRAQIVDAANRAGIPRERISLLSESRAAAWFYVGRSRSVPAGHRLAVFDFGAGTCDVAVIEKTASGNFDVVANAGRDGLGGRYFDARIWDWVRSELTEYAPTLLAELESPRGMRARLEVTDRIRAAKETLSDLASASIVVSGRAGEVVLTITREQFDALIDEDVTDAAALTRTVLDRAGEPRPHTIYLTGGSSLVPLVHTKLSRSARVAELGDPKMVVVLGALASVQPQPAAPSPAPRPVPFAPESATRNRPSTRALIAGGVGAALVVAIGVGVWLSTRSDDASGGTTVVAEQPAVDPAADGTDPDAGADAATVACTGNDTECALAQRLPLSLVEMGTYSCSAYTTDLVGLDVATTCRSSDGSPAMTLMQFGSAAEMNSAFEVYHDGAADAVPESGAWPDPTSTIDWDLSTGDKGGVMLSGRNVDTDELYVTTTVDSDNVVMHLVSSSLTSGELVEFWSDNSVLADAE